MTTSSPCLVFFSPVDFTFKEFLGADVSEAEGLIRQNINEKSRAE